MSKKTLTNLISQEDLLENHQQRSEFIPLLRKQLPLLSPKELVQLCLVIHPDIQRVIVCDKSIVEPRTSILFQALMKISIEEMILICKENLKKKERRELQCIEADIWCITTEAIVEKLISSEIDYTQAIKILNIASATMKDFFEPELMWDSYVGKLFSGLTPAEMMKMCEDSISRGLEHVNYWRVAGNEMLQRLQWPEKHLQGNSDQIRSLCNNANNIELSRIFIFKGLI